MQAASGGNTGQYDKALKFRDSQTYKVDTWEAFQKQIEEGGLILAHWDGTGVTESAIKEATKATIRCIPLLENAEQGKCVFSGQPSSRRVVFARAY